ncbi:MAG: glycosyl hydrolase family 28 protein, partial [Terriglobales bacterium]
VANDHFYTGHGMSIGSETSGGVSAVRVRNLTVDGAVNGLRIKSNASRGGLVTGVTYDNICLRGVRHPIVVNAFYGLPRHGRAAPGGDSPPVFRGIVFRRVTILGAGRIVLDGYSAADPARLRFNGVFAARPGAISVRARHARVRIGPRGSNLPLPAAAAPSGPVHASTAGGAACQDRFVPLPASAVILRPASSLPSGVAR